MFLQESSLLLPSFSASSTHPHLAHSKSTTNGPRAALKMPRHRRANEHQNKALPSVETQRFVTTPRHFRITPHIYSNTRIYPARLHARRRYATKTLRLGCHREVMWSGIPPQRLLPPVACSSMTLNRLHKACQSEGCQLRGPTTAVMCDCPRANRREMVADIFATTACTYR